MENILTLPSDQNATGRTLGTKEIAAVTRAIESGTLTSTKGEFTKRFETEFARMLGTGFAYACSSGSAAVHTAIAALDLEPGDEIVTTAITDMGALAPILYQGAIPVFADVDPLTCNVTAETIEAVLSERTQAIVATHLFGTPCQMDAIADLARRRGLYLIEDCAQAFLASYRDRQVGTIGQIGCFSLQQGKHITTGEGGIVVTSDERLARRMRLFINKAWGYGDEHPDHYFLALNYRISELQGAVACAQLAKLPDIVESRIRTAAMLTQLLSDLPGIATPPVREYAQNVYWKFALRIDPRVYPDGPGAFAQRLRGYDISSVPRYIVKPAFACAVFRDRKTFGSSQYPFTLARPQALDYDRARFPGTYEGLEHILVLPWNERYGREHVEYLAQALHEVADQLGAAVQA